MESAIPSHLRCPRSRPARASEDYVPPYPAWAGRLKPSVTQVVMAYLGVQYRGDAGRTKAHQFVAAMHMHFAGTDGPAHHDLVHYVDEAGFDTLIAIAYWDATAPFHRWLATPSLAQWWDAPERAADEVGYFREIICPRTEHFETLFSNAEGFEGAGRLAAGPSDEVQEHAYWGSMRDRFAVSQTDALRAANDPRLQQHAEPGQRIRVAPRDNLALIRSGQDWSHTRG